MLLICVGFCPRVYATSSEAKDCFVDVTTDMSIYPAVAWAVENGITNGVGEGRFDPDSNVTLLQVATMLCRASKVDTDHPVDYAWQQGWIISDGVRDLNVCYLKSSALKTLFAFKEIPYYDSVFSTGEIMSVNDNYLRIAKELGIITDTTNLLVSRGDFVDMLYKMSMTDYAKQIEDPKAFPFVCDYDDFSYNIYYVMAAKVPEQIWDRFIQDGWIVKIDGNYLGNFTEKWGKSVIGMTDMSEKTIYIADHTALIHEFGHYLDLMSGIVSRGDIFTEERKGGQMFLSDYADTDNMEYFAEYFVAFLNAQNSPRLGEMMQEYTPKTYAYFQNLADSGWIE